MEEQITVREQQFEKWRQTVGLWLGPLFFILLLVIRIPGLTPGAQNLAAVLSLVLVWWMCEPVPIPVTAVFGPALCVVLSISDAKKLLANFADPVVFVFFGGFMLAQAMMAHGLDRRIALSLLSTRLVGDSTPRLLLVFGAIGAFISMWISNTAATAMLLPIAIGILSEIGDLIEKETGKPVNVRALRLSTGLMLMTAYAASIGGIGTPIGTPPNLIGIGMISKLLHRNISFFAWMRFAVPMLIVMFGALYLILLIMLPPEMKKVPGMKEYMKRRRSELGPWTMGQINTTVAFCTAVVLWITPGVLALFLGTEHRITKGYGSILPEGIIAVLAACLLFLLPTDWKKRQFTLTWSEASKIDWGTILLFGGGLALGSLAFSTGLAEAAGKGIISVTGVKSLAGITLMSVVLGIIISETTSNTASATMVIPVVIAVAQSAGVDPVLPALAACLGSSYGFMLPVSTPPNALVYGTGMVPITRMAKTGLVFDLVGVALIFFGLKLLI